MDNCIESPGYRDEKGYVRLNREGKMWLAHRWAWTQNNGPIPKGMCILHRCDNPPCVNPDHLFVGTQGDNMRDMSEKGRNHQQAKEWCPEGHLYDSVNTYITPSGARQCKECRRVKARLRYLTMV